MPASSTINIWQGGKISWFGGPHDPTSGPTTSSGAPVSYPAISTYNQATKGGYWLVHMPNGHQAVLKQTDIGPAPWTNRNFDFTYTALPLLGYSEGNFPTDAHINAMYLGKSVPQQYAHLVIGPGSHPISKGSAPAPKGRGGSTGGTGPQTNISTGFSGGTTDWGAAGAAALMAGADKPINPNGKFHADSLLSRLLSNASSGQYLTPQQANTSFTVTPGTKAPPTKGSGRPISVPGVGDINPLPGWRIGRTDMGVDANAAVGKPILAMNDSRVTNILSNWFSGQPLVAMQIINGPNKGKFWYVAEQINNLPHVGQVIPRGGVVARYAPSGTGIEIGWAGNAAGRTLAQTTTGYSEGQVTPAGSDYRHRILHA